MDQQPILIGSVVCLRPLRTDDFEALLAIASDPLMWEQHAERDRYKPEVFSKFFAAALASGGALVVTDAKTGEIVGSSRFHGYDSAASEVEIGWTFLKRSHWGGANNREMKRLMIGHALKSVTTVVMLVDENNFRSQRAIEKIGGKRTGSVPNNRGGQSFRYAATEIPSVANPEH